MQEKQRRAQVANHPKRLKHTLSVHKTAATRLFSHKYEFSSPRWAALYFTSDFQQEMSLKAALVQLQGAPLWWGGQELLVPSRGKMVSLGEASLHFVGHHTLLKQVGLGF